MDSAAEIAIEPLAPGHVSGVLALLQNAFRLDEPVARARKFTAEECDQIFQDVIQVSLAHEISFVAIDPALRGDDRVIGCRLSSLKTPDDPPFLFVKENYPRRIQEQMVWLESMVEDFYKNLSPSITKIMKFDILCVAAAYRRRGIAARLVQRGLAAGREAGCQQVVVIASSAKSQRLFEGLKFATAKTTRFHDYKDPLSGEAIFKDVSPDNEFAKLMAQSL